MRPSSTPCAALTTHVLAAGPHACWHVLPLQVADLNALAELGKVYQDSLALSAQLRNLSSFRLQQDKVLGRGSLAVVQEGALGAGEPGGLGHTVQQDVSRQQQQQQLLLLFVCLRMRSLSGEAQYVALVFLAWLKGR